MNDTVYELKRNEIATVLSFGLLAGWIISLPYEGPVYYAFIENAAQLHASLNSYNLLLLAAGLLAGGIVPAPSHSVRSVLLIVKIVCLLLSLTLLILPEVLWNVAIPSLSCLAGVGMSLYGHQVKYHVAKNRWALVAPISMVLACLVVIATQLLITIVSTRTGFLFAEASLAASIVTLVRTDSLAKKKSVSINDSFSSILRKFWLLFIFIFIVTINAGIMFRIVFPAFAEFPLLASIYTNLPYIGAIVFFSMIFKGNKFNTLFIGLALWGVALLLFSHFTPSIVLFLLVITAMLFASGIFDLFWWTIFTTSFDYVQNPATMFGAILSVNVLGSLTGGAASDYLLQSGLSPTVIAQLGLAVIMVSMVLIVPLNKIVSPLLTDNTFLEKQHWNRIDDIDAAVRTKLSSRELDVYRLLLTGISDKEIGESLNISINTVKSHNRKIYAKLEVSNRIELKNSFPGHAN